MKVVEINDVFKTYHDTEVEVKAVNGVTLSFEKGDFAVIVGPSGSGKTTLLNLIGGLDQPTAGEIIVAGHRLSELKPSELIDFRGSSSSRTTSYPFSLRRRTWSS